MTKQEFAGRWPVLVLALGILAHGVGVARAAVAISLDATSGTLTPSQIQTINAPVRGSQNTAVTWSVTPNVGSLATAGNRAVYTAPVTIGAGQTIMISATTMAAPATTASALITLLPLVTL